MRIAELLPVLNTLGLDDIPRLSLVSASELEKAHVPAFPPDASALLTDLEMGELSEQVKRVLLAVYPATHPARFVSAAGEVRDVILSEWQGTEKGCLFVPALAQGTSFEAFQEIIAHLRAPDGCPWDRKQTHLTLRQHLIEESYEALDAIDSGDTGKMAEEFGDVLLQVVLNAQIAREADEFRMTDVLQGIYDKIVRRHPHVFGDVQVDGVGEVLSNWEKIKAEERKDQKSEKGILDGVSKALPALGQAQEYQERAARVGFDWPEIEGVLAKIEEEIAEVRSADSPEALAGELGDLLFALVNLARWQNVQAENALRGTNQKFYRRFGYVEHRAREQGRTLPEMTLQEMDDFWNEAKRLGM